MPVHQDSYQKETKFSIMTFFLLLFYQVKYSN